MKLHRYEELHQLRSLDNIHTEYLAGQLTARQAQVNLIGSGFTGREATQTVIDWLDVRQTQRRLTTDK